MESSRRNTYICLFTSSSVKVTVNPTGQDKRVVGIELVYTTPHFITLWTSPASGKRNKSGGHGQTRYVPGGVSLFGGALLREL